MKLDLMERRWNGVNHSTQRVKINHSTQRVKINDQFSEDLEVKYGSVQGSVLGPKFFNIYVRSQPQVFEENGFEEVYKSLFTAEEYKILW